MPKHVTSPQWRLQVDDRTRLQLCITCPLIQGLCLSIIQGEGRQDDLELTTTAVPWLSISGMDPAAATTKAMGQQAKKSGRRQDRAGTKQPQAAHASAGALPRNSPQAEATSPASDPEQALHADFPVSPQPASSSSGTSSTRQPQPGRLAAGAINSRSDQATSWRPAASSGGGSSVSAPPNQGTEPMVVSAATAATGAAPLSAQHLGPEDFITLMKEARKELCRQNRYAGIGPIYAQVCKVCCLSMLSR